MIWNQLMMNSRSRSRSFWKQASDEDDDDDNNDDADGYDGDDDVHQEEAQSPG